MIDIDAQADGTPTANGIHWGDLNALDAPATYSIGEWSNIKDDGGGALYQKANGLVDGLVFVVEANEALTVRHYTGSVLDAVTCGNISHYEVGNNVNTVTTWDGANMVVYKDGVDDTLTAPQTGAIGTNVKNAGWGDSDAAAFFGGQSALIGHMVAWMGTVLTIGEAVQFNAGVTMPQIANLTFWCRGTGTFNDIQGAGGAGIELALDADVTFVSDDIDGYFLAGGGYKWLLAEIFASTLVGAQHLFGGASFLNPARVVKFLDKKCVIGDWGYTELKELIEDFTSRPRYFDYGTAR